MLKVEGYLNSTVRLNYVAYIVGGKIIWMCHAVDQSGGPDGFWANMCKYGSFSRLTQDFLTKENIFKEIWSPKNW